ncbi:hypothetical protein K501DRAFT_329706 [Backusella circina FSU 941]|nr:hypothetical protein K501DRAFT_329706 [Backusella circina FSU 941]
MPNSLIESISQLDNLTENIQYSLDQIAAFTQSQLLDPLEQNQNESINTIYTSFPLLETVDPSLTKTQYDSTPDTPTTSTDSPTRVTRPPNAYLLFNREMRKKLKQSNPNMTVGEISKEVGTKWKSLSKTEKDRFVREANKLKQSQKELHPDAVYIRRSKSELIKAGHKFKAKRYKELKADTSSIRKRYKRDKNPKAPKHPLSPYMWYLTEQRPETMRQYPGSTVGQISKLCADKWNTMSDQAQLPWKTKAEADKERYANEMQIYALHNNHSMGRGTRQKYRNAAPTTVHEDPMLPSSNIFFHHHHHHLHQESPMSKSVLPNDLSIIKMLIVTDINTCF